jgi:hypothetical protein
MMRTKPYFPVFHWTVRTLTGRLARRIYVIIVLFTLLLTTAVRLRSYFMARKIQSVLRGLGELHIDQATEEQLAKIVPYLTHKDLKVGGFSHRAFYVHISNESDRLTQVVVVALNAAQSDELMLWLEHLADWLGYRFVSFDASVLVQDGKVVHVDYGLANQWERPQYAGYTGYIVSARSVHGFWLPHEMGLEVTSTDDDSPQYRPRGLGKSLNVIYTSDASTDLTRRIFDLNLSCFWSLRTCDDAREIAPRLWHDAQAIQEAAYQQLISEKCPDSIVEGRMRYLPDISVLLLEVTGSRQVEVNEDGSRTEDWFTDYKLKEVIRGRSFGSWKNVRFGRTIPSPMDPTRKIANQIWPPTKIGSQVLFFGGLGFDSCRFVPATPSALEIVRKTPVPLKRPEDQIPRGLM